MLSRRYACVFGAGAFIGTNEKQSDDEHAMLSVWNMWTTSLPSVTCKSKLSILVVRTAAPCVELPATKRAGGLHWLEIEFLDFASDAPLIVVAPVSTAHARFAAEAYQAVVGAIKMPAVTDHRVKTNKLSPHQRVQRKMLSMVAAQCCNETVEGRIFPAYAGGKAIAKGVNEKIFDARYGDSKKRAAVPDGGGGGEDCSSVGAAGGKKK